MYTCSAKSQPVPANVDPTASWIRAPAESSSHMVGLRYRSASSLTRAALNCSPTAPIDPAMTVKSYAITHTCRPSTSPCPVTTPSAGDVSEPSRLFASRPSSTNVPASKRRSTRSRAVSLPFACCLAICSGPPMPRFLRFLAASSPTLASYSFVIAAILFPDQEIFPPAPTVQESIHVPLRQPLALRGLGGFPQAVVVLHDAQTWNDHRLASTFSQPEAEFEVGDPVEAKPLVETARGERVRAPERHAVALDRVDLGPGALLELLHRRLAAHAEGPRDRDTRIVEGAHQRRDRIARELDARIEQDDD